MEYWNPSKSIHYHATLQAGENTLEMSIARVLMKSIIANNGQFNEDAFRRAYIDFMLQKGSHNDTYSSTCHRMFFANMIFNKKDPRECPDNDGHNVDTIDGLILPTITALAETARPGNMNEESKSAIENASARTAAVTRSSQLLENVSKVWSSLVSAALITPNTSISSNGNEMEPPIIEVAQKLRMSRPSPNRKDQMRYVTAINTLLYYPAYPLLTYMKLYRFLVHVIYPSLYPQHLICSTNTPNLHFLREQMVFGKLF